MPGYKGALAGPSATTDLRYGYPDVVRFQYDVSPLSGGWLPFSLDLLSVNVAGIPGYVGINVVGAGSWQANYPLAFARENLTDAPGAIWTLKNISVRYYRAAANADIRLRLYSMLKDGSAAPVVEREWSQVAEFTVATGTWTTYTIPADITEALDVETRIYWLEILLIQFALGEVRISTITLDIEKTAVE